MICGFGRLGTWFGAQHYGVTPDMITFAKAVTSGYLPLGGVIVGEAVRRPLEADPGFMLRHGFTYSGQWKDARCHGRGTMESGDGSTYSGMWKEGKYNGQGTMKYPDGSRYTGGWRDGSYDGFGTFAGSTGERHTGQWKDGKPSGKGTHVQPSGRMYRGDWKDGKPHGFGSSYNAKGRLEFQGRWIEGEFVGK